MKKLLTGVLTLAVVVTASFFTVKATSSKSIEAENVEALAQNEAGGSGKNCTPVNPWFCSGTSPMLFYPQ